MSNPLPRAAQNCASIRNWVLIAAAALCVSQPASAADQGLLLDVWVNGFAINKVGQFVLRDGELLSQAQELSDLGFKMPPGIKASTDGLIPLSALPGTTWKLDLGAQALHVTAPNDDIMPEVLDAGGSGTKGSHDVESGTGATINYDVTGNAAGKQDVLSGLLDTRIFSPYGVISSGLLAYAGGGLRGPGTESMVRLDSTYVYSDTASQRRYYLGDFITGGLAWTRPVRFGGVQITSDYSMRPDLITFPLPSLSGVAAVPSAVDVLVNGTRILSQEVNPGPFEIPQLPVVTGAGTIALAVTNAVGRQVTVDLPFYASAAMLSPGFQTWTAQAGEVRHNYGAVSADYENSAASYTWRRGITSWLTLESSGETTSGTNMAGGGAVVNLDDLAVLNAAGSSSLGGGRSGSQFSAGVQRIGRVFSFGLSGTSATRHYRDIAAVNGDPVPTLQLNANASLTLGRFGSFGVAYASIDSATGTDIATQAIVNPGTALMEPTSALITHAHVLSGSYSVQINDMSLYATAYRDFSHGGGNGMLVGLTIPIGARSSVNFGLSNGSGGRDANVQAQESPVVIGDWGYQAYGNAATTNREFVEGEYKSPWGLLTAGVAHMSGQNAYTVEDQGAISFIDGSFFPSNTIYDSFAVVDTGGLAGIHVLSENRDAGMTDSAGQALVPDLRSFNVNHLAIVATDVPLDTTIGATTYDARPQDRSGVVVKFQVQVSHAAVLNLRDQAGHPIPVGSSGKLQSSGVAVPIGYEGEAYVEDLTAHNTLLVELPNANRCSVSFDYTPVEGQIPTIGPLTCKDAIP
jgi:outer membrane usher protein